MSGLLIECMYSRPKVKIIPTTGGGILILVPDQVEFEFQPNKSTEIDPKTHQLRL